MPRRTDPKVKERCLQQMLERVAEYPNPTAAAAAVAKRNGVGVESVRPLVWPVADRWWPAAWPHELEEIRELEAKVRRLEEGNEVLRRASIFFAGELDPRGR